jgi:hypothetical protein
LDRSSSGAAIYLADNGSALPSLAPYSETHASSSSMSPRRHSIRLRSSTVDSVRKLFVGSSVVLISHRFSSVRMADMIYVLRERRIVEGGSHHELIGLDGLYAELFRLQAAPFNGNADSLERLDLIGTVEREHATRSRARRTLRAATACSY